MGVILKINFYFLLICIGTLFSQFNISGNDFTIYQFDKNNMSDNDIIVFSSAENIKVIDGKLKLFPLLRNNIARARLRYKVRNGSEIVLKIDNIPFNGDGRLKLITSDNNFIQLMFYDNEGAKSLVVSEKILSNDEQYLYRKITPLSSSIFLKVRFQKDKTVFYLGYVGRSFDKFFETDLTLDNFMIQLEAATKVDNPNTSIDIDWIVVSTEK